jgi:hypothetical protein
MLYLVMVLAARLSVRFANLGYFLDFAVMRGASTDAYVAYVCS